MKTKRQPVATHSRIPRLVKAGKRQPKSRIPRYVGHGKSTAKQSRQQQPTPAIRSFLHLLKKQARVEGRRHIDGRVGEILQSLTTEPVAELTVTIDKRIRKRTMMVIIKPDKNLFTAFWIKYSIMAYTLTFWIELTQVFDNAIFIYFRPSLLFKAYCSILASPAPSECQL